MGFFSKVLNGILLVFATGKIPKVGKLFRLSPRTLDVLTIHDFPNNGNSPYNCRKLIPDRSKNSTLLILNVQEGVPLWDLWIQVLFCSDDHSKEDLLIGWISYTDFNQLVLTEWDRWEEEKNPKENSE
jgi:hypothetical protein